MKTCCDEAKSCASQHGATFLNGCEFRQVDPPPITKTSKRVISKQVYSSAKFVIDNCPSAEFRQDVQAKAKLAKLKTYVSDIPELLTVYASSL